jgi:hypothetical protein
MGLKMLAAQCTPSARENSLLEYLNSKPQHMQNFRAIDVLDYICIQASKSADTATSPHSR